MADQRKAGKLVGYMSVPLSPAGGGNFDLNREVASSAADAIVQRFGTDQIFVLNPTIKDFDLPNASGADYMLLWTMLLEGPNGLGEDLDFTYFVGPQDFARFFKLNGNADMAKIDAFFDDRVKTNPGFAKAVRRRKSAEFAASRPPRAADHDRAKRACVRATCPNTRTARRCARRRRLRTPRRHR